MKKENIEIRFFFNKNKVERALKLWREEKRKFEPYSFIDYYFTKKGKIIKIRKWISKHRPKIELIRVQRKKGVKKEKSISTTLNIIKKLKEIGYKKEAIIKKKKACLIVKSNKPTYAIEYVPKVGWTGEIEVKRKNKNLIPSYILYLKKLGASGFTTKSLLEIYKKR